MAEPLSDLDVAKRVQLRAAAIRQLAYQQARDSLAKYIQLQMPDPESDEPLATRYEMTPQAYLLCSIMEKIERGEPIEPGKRAGRVAVSIGPQMGKSEIITRGAPAWIAGRNPIRNIMVGTYNATFAMEFGEQVRHRIQSSIHKAIFPSHTLRKGAVDLLVTEQEGRTAFVGVGGSGSGKPADFFFVDDPIRNDEDAQSEAYRDKVWKWFSGVVFARLKRRSSVVVVHTRWNGDDLIGRLCDPDHPERHKEYRGIADPWTYINIPAVIDDPKLAEALGLRLEPPVDPYIIRAFGTKPMSALWPNEKPLELLAEAKILDPRTFGALYMGKPTPDDGEYFRAEWLVEYQAHEMPVKLKKFGASDHAVSVKADRDHTVIGCVGVDENDDIWVMPDLKWDRLETPETVEELLYQFRTHKPELWWLEDELISKSFGPFLKKRMYETKTYVTLDPQRPGKDKRTRARAIQGRMQMRKVRFPAFASWWPDARRQILQFDRGANDDFIDWLAHIGMGLLKEARPGREAPVNDNVIRTGSPRWVVAQARLRSLREQRIAANKGW